MEKPQQTDKETLHHATQEEIEQMKTHLGHIFDFDDLGNLTLKPLFNILPFKMIFVRGGKFIMGDNDLRSDPHHLVELTYNFYVSEYLVTQQFYQAITGKNPSKFLGFNHPVESVNWMEAVDFCNLLNKKVGFNLICDEDYELLDKNFNKINHITDVSGFRLPSEIEWEFAAQGGILSTPIGLSSDEGCIYSGSNHLDEVGWYQDNNNYETRPVGLKFPNSLGLYDLSGNVWEWCWDWFDKSFYKKKSVLINEGNSSKSSTRILRGGSWLNYEYLCRAAIRNEGDPIRGSHNYGFRLAFTV